MNEDVLWVLKVFFVMFCLWYITGGPARFKQEVLVDKKVPVQNKATVYQPKTYYQTVILR